MGLPFRQGPSANFPYYQVEVRNSSGAKYLQWFQYKKDAERCMSFFESQSDLYDPWHDCLWLVEVTEEGKKDLYGYT